MRLIIRGRETYQILDEIRTPFGLSDQDYIVLKDGFILLWREKEWPFENRFVNIEELSRIISETELKNWRNESRKKTQLDHLRSALSLMISHNRNFIIDDILSKETHYDILCYAC